MATSDVITIGKDRFILDPTGDGRYAQASDLAEQLAAHSPLTEEALPGYIPTYSTNWRLEQQQRVGSGYCLCQAAPKKQSINFVVIVTSGPTKLGAIDATNRGWNAG